MASKEYIKEGVRRNNRIAWDAFNKQLSIIYRRITPTGNHLRFIIPFPKAATKYLLEYANISIPSNANLDSLFFVIYNSAGGLKYVSENLRNGQNGAKLNLFTTPGADKDPTAAGDQKQFKGMLPIFLEWMGEEEVIIDIRGNGLAALPWVDIMLTGHQQNRIHAEGGYSGNN